MKTGSPPPEIISAIEALSAGVEAEIPAAYATLQRAFIGEEGCLRAALPQTLEWADRVWDRIVPLLKHANNHVRSIAGQALCNLGPSASVELALRDFGKIESVTRDERFVTARHTLQTLWKLGLGHARLRARLLAYVAERFRTCGAEKNGTLVRYDLQVGLRSLFDATGDVVVKALSVELMECIEDPKYKKKYQAVWRASGARQ